MKRVYTAVYCPNIEDCNGPILSTYDSRDKAVEPLLLVCEQYWKNDSFQSMLRDMDTHRYIASKEELAESLRNLDYIIVDTMGYVYIDMQTLNQTNPLILDLGDA